MKKNYFELANRVRRSSNPDGFAFNKVLLNETVDVPYTDANEYVKLSMLGVPHEYTATSEKAANMVIEILRKNHGNEVDFRKQGSIVTNTHIWNENDVDIVQITRKSNSLDTTGLQKALTIDKFRYNSMELINLQKRKDNFSKYAGDQNRDLRNLRIKSEIVLVNTYEKVNVEKSKAICVEMQNPKRNIDVVTAVDYHAVQFMASNKEYKRGIQIYDKLLDDKLPAEFPFWSIKLINDRHIESGRRFKKLIRFFKNIKFDCSTIQGRKLTITSFDINAICYSIKVHDYQHLHYLALVGVLSIKLHELIDNEYVRNSLRSIDQQEDIFKVKGNSKVDDLIIIAEFLDELLQNIVFQNRLVG
jgi:hypothetical protein